MRNETANIMCEALRENNCEAYCDGNCCFKVEVAVKYLIENGLTIAKDNNVPTGWIPASEKPKEAGEYNVMIKGASVSTTLFYSAKLNAWYEFSDDDFEQPYEITHWMPLPKPPKEEL